MSSKRRKREKILVNDMEILERGWYNNYVWQAKNIDYFYFLKTLN